MMTGVSANRIRAASMVRIDVAAIASPTGIPFSFHEIDLDHTASGGQGCDIGHENIDEDELEDIGECDAESHRPDDAIQPQTVGQEIQDQQNRQAADDAGRKQIGRYP